VWKKAKKTFQEGLEFWDGNELLFLQIHDEDGHEASLLHGEPPQVIILVQLLHRNQRLDPPKQLSDLHKLTTHSSTDLQN